MSNKSLVYCTLAHALNHTQILVLAALLPLFKAMYGLSYLETEGIISLYLFFYALFNPLAGVLFRKASKELMVFLGKAVSGLSLAMMATINGYLPLLLIQALYGSAGGLYHPSGTSILAERYDKKVRGRVMGVHGFGSSLGMILGPVAIGFFISAYDYRLALYLLALTSLGFGAVFYGAMRKVQIEKKAGMRRISLGGLKTLVAAFGLRESVFWGIKAFLPLYAVAFHGFGLASAAALLALLPLVGLFANLLGGYLADRYDRLLVTRAAVMLTALSLGGLYFFTDLRGFYLLVILTALGIYMTLPTFDSLLADITPEGGYVQAYGAMYGLGFLLGALLPLGIGLLSDLLNPGLSFLFMSSVMLACFALLAKIN